MSHVLAPKGVVAKWPYSFADLRRDNPQVSFPAEPTDEMFAAFDVHPVVASTKPSTAIGEDAREVAPVLIGGVWTQQWKVVAADPSVVKARRIEKEKGQIKLDAFVASFVEMTPAEVDAYIDANVTNLASAKNVIGKLAMMVLVLAKREFR